MTNQPVSLIRQANFDIQTAELLEALVPAIDALRAALGLTPPTPKSD